MLPGVAFSVSQRYWNYDTLLHICGTECNFDILIHMCGTEYAQCCEIQKDTVRGTDDNFQLFMPQAKGADGQMLSLAFRFLRVKT